MSFYVQKWPDISNGWSDIPSKTEAKENERRGGGEEIEEKKEVKSTKQKERKREGREERMENRKEKELG